MCSAFTCQLRRGFGTADMYRSLLEEMAHTDYTMDSRRIETDHAHASFNEPIPDGFYVEVSGLDDRTTWTSPSVLYSVLYPFTRQSKVKWYQSPRRWPSDQPIFFSDFQSTTSGHDSHEKISGPFLHHSSLLVYKAAH